MNNLVKKIKTSEHKQSNESIPPKLHRGISFFSLTSKDILLNVHLYWRCRLTNEGYFYFLSFIHFSKFLVLCFVFPFFIWQQRESIKSCMNF